MNRTQRPPALTVGQILLFSVLLSTVNGVVAALQPVFVRCSGSGPLKAFGISFPITMYLCLLAEPWVGRYPVSDRGKGLIFCAGFSAIAFLGLTAGELRWLSGPYLPDAVLSVLFVWLSVYGAILAATDRQTLLPVRISFAAGSALFALMLTEFRFV